MAEYAEIYARARHYDLVFGRDVTRDVDFVQAAFHRHAGRAARSALDLACGPGYHARALAGRGLRTYGLDLRPEMVDFAQREAEREGTAPTFFTGDIRSFELPEPVDMALAMFDAVDSQLTDEDVVQHFRCVARALVPGGLYILEMSHPRDFPYLGYDAFPQIAEKPGLRVEVLWGANNPRRNLATGIMRVQVQMRVVEDGVEQSFEDWSDERAFIPREIELLARASGVFDVAAWYGDFSLDQPLDETNQAVWMIGVLRRR